MRPNQANCKVFFVMHCSNEMTSNFTIFQLLDAGSAFRQQPPPKRWQQRRSRQSPNSFNQASRVAADDGATHQGRKPHRG